ncbi:Hypothetical predicted protein [Olea europaea subsp. europaea]|uniref:Uncharacterized protein n=1 Tax=Olea europaea subsp. europaea TaxID=158383 RepID=A0A8S0PPV9_OLEEU|nr:Hypothetical predicted protein [Olea europaea subsp. europaea]
MNRIISAVHKCGGKGGDHSSQVAITNQFLDKDFIFIYSFLFPHFELIPSLKFLSFLCLDFLALDSWHFFKIPFQKGRYSRCSSQSKIILYLHPLLKFQVIELNKA